MVTVAAAITTTAGRIVAAAADHPNVAATRIGVRIDPSTSNVLAWVNPHRPHPRA